MITEQKIWKFSRRSMAMLAASPTPPLKSTGVTGDVVGQVASQTLENMTVIAEATTLEVLRPLVGMDKDEISAEAQRIGTFPISIMPDEDCCTLFTPKHPATRARLAAVEQAELALPIEGMVSAAVAATIVQDFRFPMLESTAARSATPQGEPA